jgi:hypothetical protein
MVQQLLLLVWDKRMTKIFRSKRDEVRGGWRKLHTEDFRFHNLLAKYFIGQIQENTTGVTCIAYGTGQKMLQSFSRKA